MAPQNFKPNGSNDDHVMIVGTWPTFFLLLLLFIVRLVLNVVLPIVYILSTYGPYLLRDDPLKVACNYLANTIRGIADGLDAPNKLLLAPVLSHATFGWARDNFSARHQTFKLLRSKQQQQLALGGGCSSGSNVGSQWWWQRLLAKLPLWRGSRGGGRAPRHTQQQRSLGGGRAIGGSGPDGVAAGGWQQQTIDAASSKAAAKRKSVGGTTSNNSTGGQQTLPVSDQLGGVGSSSSLKLKS